MFYYILLISLSGLATVLTNPINNMISNAPERCCVAKQFSSKTSLSIGMVLPSGETYSSFAHYNFSYDHTRGMVGLKGVSTNILDGVSMNLWIIQNLNEGQTYVIIMDTKTCEKSANSQQAFYCIPETATYLYSSNYGYGDKQIVGDTWLVKVNGTTNYITSSRGDCVPLTSYSFSQQPEMVTSVTTTDFVPQIDDPSIFDIPAECQHLI